MHIYRNMKLSENTIVCRCEDITYKDVIKAIENGYTSLDEIKRHLRTGMGHCQGRTCLPLIARIISKKTGKKMSEIVLPRDRPPARSVPLGIFSECDDK